MPASSPGRGRRGPGCRRLPDHRRIAWDDVERFDNLLGLVIITRSREVEVGALQGSTLRHVVRGRRDHYDDVPTWLSVDTIEGRANIRWTAIGITLFTVAVGVWRTWFAG